MAANPYPTPLATCLKTLIFGVSTPFPAKYLLKTDPASGRHQLAPVLTLTTNTKKPAA